MMIYVYNSLVFHLILLLCDFCLQALFDMFPHHFYRFAVSPAGLKRINVHFCGRVLHTSSYFRQVYNMLQFHEPEL